MSRNSLIYKSAGRRNLLNVPALADGVAPVPVATGDACRDVFILSRSP